MSTLNPRQRVLGRLLGEKIDRTPVTCMAGCNGTVSVEMQEAIGVYWPDGHRDPEKMAKLAIASHELTGLENVRVPFDFVVHAEALSCKTKWLDKHDYQPAVIETPYTRPEDLKMPERLLDSGRIPVVLEAISKLKEVKDRVPVVAMVTGPFILAGFLMGIERMMRSIMKQRNWVKAFVDFSTDVIIDTAKAYYKEGADIIEIAEGLASCSLLSPKDFRELAKPAFTRIAKELPGLKIFHMCGNIDPILPDLVELGYHGVSVEETIDLSKFKSFAQPRGVKVMGNVSSKSTLLRTPEEVKTESIKCLKVGVDFLEPSCGISPITPIANIKAMVEAAKQYTLT